MTTTHDDNATTWRDIADQLTAKKIRGLGQIEQRCGESGIIEHAEAKASLIGFAGDAQTNLADVSYADVPLPAGASTGEQSWCKDLKNGGYRRSLEWHTHGDTDEINVGIDGWQGTDGSFTRYISVGHRRFPGGGYRCLHCLRRRRGPRGDDGGGLRIVTRSAVSARRPSTAVAGRADKRGL